jgi:hypothetical protein
MLIFSILHFFSFLSTPSFLLLFVTHFCVEEWPKCLVLQALPSRLQM